LMIACVGLLGCRTEAVPSMPWVHGLGNPVVSDRSSDAAAERFERWSDRDVGDPNCGSGAVPAIELHADVAPPVGEETILVSLSQGVLVLDGEGRLVAETPGYACAGSADELEAVAAGDAGAPTIVIAATTGGHRESSTWITLLRVDERRLDAVFTGTVELRDGETTKRGSIVLLPNALIYRHPALQPALWVFDPVARAYLLPGTEIDYSHDDGPAQVSTR
jgi:hypothetical protein